MYHNKGKFDKHWDFCMSNIGRVVAVLAGEEFHLIVEGTSARKNNGEFEGQLQHGKTRHGQLQSAANVPLSYRTIWLIHMWWARNRTL